MKTGKLRLDEVNHRYEGDDGRHSVVVNEGRFNAEIMAFVREHPGATAKEARQAISAVVYWLDKETGVSVVSLKERPGPQGGWQ